MTDPIWSITANVGEARRLRLLRPGAKVWVNGGFAGVGYLHVTVVGRDRHKSRFLTISIRTEYLTNWRIELVYSPGAIRRIQTLRATPQGGFRLRHMDATTAGYRDALQVMCDDLAAKAERGYRTQRGDPL